MSTGIEYTVDYRTLCFRAEEEVRDLKAKVEAQDKVIRFLSDAANAKTAELRRLKTNIRNGKQFIRNGFVDHNR